MENTVKVTRINFTTAAQLAELLKTLSIDISLDTVYVQDSEGFELDTFEVIQETLSDRSIVFNVVLSKEGDPNS